MIGKFLTSTWAAFAIFMLLFLLTLWDPKPMKVLRYQVFDTFQNVFEYTVDDPDVILIDIDEATVKELGQFPFKRDVNARLTNIVGNAKTIAWALLFPEEDRLGGDYKFVKSLEKYNTVIGSSVGNESNRINIYFNKNNLNLAGWKTIDIYQNEVFFEVKNIKKNQTIDKKKFILPELN